LNSVKETILSIWIEMFLFILMCFIRFRKSELAKTGNIVIIVPKYIICFLGEISLFSEVYCSLTYYIDFYVEVVAQNYLWSYLL